MVNPIALSWFWRGLKGHSITFAALFASVLLGASISGGLHHLLSAVGIHWLYVIILPVILFSWLNKMEPRWFPDQSRRRMIARSLLFGSLLIALLVAHFRPARPADEATDEPPAQSAPRR